MNPPIIGQSVTVYGVQCTIVAIHSFGTIDVVECNGDRTWRLSGLAF